MIIGDFREILVFAIFLSNGARYQGLDTNQIKSLEFRLFQHSFNSETAQNRVSRSHFFNLILLETANDWNSEMGCLVPTSQRLNLHGSILICDVIIHSCQLGLTFSVRERLHKAPVKVQWNTQREREIVL